MSNLTPEQAWGEYVGEDDDDNLMSVEKFLSHFPSMSVEDAVRAHLSNVDGVPTGPEYDDIVFALTVYAEQNT